MKLKLALTICVISVLGCATIVGTDTTFAPWKGKQTYFDGSSGGAVEIFEGVEFWTVGTPDRPIKAIGVITQNKAEDRDTVNRLLFGDFNKREISKLVKAYKGDGVVMLTEKDNVTVYPSAGTVATIITTKLCVFRYENSDDSVNPVKKQSAQGASYNMQVVPTTPTTMLSKDGTFKITLPAEWIQAPPLSPTQQLYAKNSLIDAGLIVSSVKSTDIQDWETYVKSQQAKMVSAFVQSSSSEFRQIKVNGFDGLQTDIAGTLKNGLKIHYLSTFIKTGNQHITFLTWCVESQFASNRSKFEAQLASLEFLETTGELK